MGKIWARIREKIRTHKQKNLAQCFHYAVVEGSQ